MGLTISVRRKVESSKTPEVRRLLLGLRARQLSQSSTPTRFKMTWIQSIAG